MSENDLRYEFVELRQRVHSWPLSPYLMDGSFPKVTIQKDLEKKNYELKLKNFPIYEEDRTFYRE